MERKVTAVIGALPEVEGFALARFSRSKPETSFADWILSLSRERAETFYEQFYHKYGHASIADLAHVGLAVENISIVAAVALLDEPLLDAQERSTRYIDFTRATYHMPAEIEGTPFAGTYNELCSRMFEEYRSFHDRILVFLKEKYGRLRPPGLDDRGFEETAKAKAFDLARYLLPSSTLTGAGFLASGRTLERHVSALLSSELSEIRGMAGEIKEALVRKPALNPIRARLEPLLDKSGLSPDVRREIDFETYRDCVPLPTLVKYAEPNPYASALREGLRDWIARRLKGLPAPDGVRGVALCEPESLAAEVAAGLLYTQLPHSFDQVLSFLTSRSKSKDEILSIMERHRGPREVGPRELAAGYELVFDVCMDNGSFRDLHRHRNMVQIVQPFDHRLGYDTPDEIHEAGLQEAYHRLHQDVLSFASRLFVECPRAVQYVLPLSFRRRALFKMSLWQLRYLVELRSRPHGHFSYRDIAIKMHEAFSRRHPALAGLIKTPPVRPEDFFVR